MSDTQPSLDDFLIPTSDEDDDKILGDVDDGVLDATLPSFLGETNVYRESDVLKPLGWSPERISDLQRLLSKASLLNPNSVNEMGTYDSATETAYKSLLVQSNRSGTDALLTARRLGNAEAARRLKETERRNASGGGGRAPTIRLTNPEDLRQTFKQVARSLTGGVFIEDDQIENMVKAFQSQEASFQRAAIGGGTVTAPPNAQNFAAAELEKTGGVTANRFAQMAGVLEDLVGEARAV